MKQIFEILAESFEGIISRQGDQANYSEGDQKIEYRFEIISRTSASIRLRIFELHQFGEISEMVTIVRIRDNFQLRRGHRTIYAKKKSKAQSSQDEGRNDLVSPMPGFIRKVLVSEGQSVKKGDRLAVLEAMKMEHALTAPFNGIVKQVFFKEGDRVGQDEIIVKLEAEVKKTS